MDIIKKINKAKNIFEILPQLTVAELEKAIEITSENYHNSDITFISDEVYDIIVEKLKLLNPNSKFIKSIGAPIRGKKIELPYWMGSMEKLNQMQN